MKTHLASARVLLTDAYPNKPYSHSQASLFWVCISSSDVKRELNPHHPHPGAPLGGFVAGLEVVGAALEGFVARLEVAGAALGVTVLELEFAEPALRVTVLGLEVAVLGLEVAEPALGGGMD